MSGLRNKIFQIFALTIALLMLSGCATDYANREPLGKEFPSISGQSLSGQAFSIPGDFNGTETLLLIGYRQKAQFDIDRWMIGLDMTSTDIPIIELPTIQGFFPRLFSSRIDEGMRSGIPENLWKIVITVYEDGGVVQSFTGNENPNNARVVLLDKSGQVIYFHDAGFSVSALNKLRQTIQDTS